jgi:hypothetical protein
VDHIEALGQHAIVIGSDTADLQVSVVSLYVRPARAQHQVLALAIQGELRSNGYIYRPDDHGDAIGSLGLPVREPGRVGFDHLFDESASVVFLRNNSRSVREWHEAMSQFELFYGDRFTNR